MAESLVAQVLSPRKRVSCDFQAARDQKPTGLQVRKKTKRRGVGGGPWRAWVHLHSKGHGGGVPKLSEVHAQYREAKALDSPLYQTAARVGSLARTLARGGLRKEACSNFGPSARTLRRQVLRRAKQAIRESLCGATLLEKSLALAERSELQSMPLQQALSHARALARAETQRKAAETATHLSLIKEFELGPGAAHLKTLRAALPESVQKWGHIVPMPSPMGPCFSVQTGDWEAAKNGLAWAAQHPKATNVAEKLGAEWSELHQLVMANSCRALTTAEDQQHSRCLDAGRCLCGGEGLTLYRMRNRFLRCVKNAFHLPSLKTALTQGLVVMQSISDMVIGGDAPDVGEEVWLHIGLMYFKPYRPTFHRLRRVACHDENSVAHDRVVLEAAHWGASPSWIQFVLSSCFLSGKRDRQQSFGQNTLKE